MPSGDADLYTQALSGVGKDLLNPAKSGNTYNRLVQASGNPTAAKAFVKSALMDSIGEGKVPKNIATILTDPNSAAAKALSPTELSQAKHLHTAHTINNTKPDITSRAHSIFSSVLGGVASKGIASLAGYEALGPAGLVAGPIAEGAIEKGVHAVQSSRAMRGAPGPNALARGAAFVGKKTVGPTALAAEHYSQDRAIQRASGGKVDLDGLVDRLMKRWKSAKRDNDKSTEPLLKLPDNVVAKALEITQKTI